jgi:hypothetical protein
MNGMIAVLHSWLGAAERLAALLPRAAASLTRGSWPAAVVMLGLGVALLVAGARLGRVLAAAGAAGVGWLAGSLLTPSFQLWNLPPETPAWAAALMLGVLALGAPEVFSVALGAIPGALLGMQVAVAGRAWVGGFAGAVVLALVALWLRKLVLAATAAGAGAALVLVALVALSARVPRLAALAQRPLLVAATAGVLAVAGAAYQLGSMRRLRPPGWESGHQLRG